LQPLATHRFHLIEAGRHTASLSDESKMKPDWALFTHLFGAGRDETSKWLDRHKGSIGRKDTAQFKARFLSPGAPPADEVTQPRAAGPTAKPAEPNARRA
jgi:NTE family protein